MEDSNIMKVKKYIPKLPNGKDGTGYDSDTRQVIEPSFINVQTAVDYDTENFKYGLEGWEDNGIHRYKKSLELFQDPLFPIFDICIDSVGSPLLVDVSKFLDDYSGIYSMNSRIKIYDEFKKTLYTLFNRDFRSIDRTKSFYVNSISGLDKLTARIVDFEKDKITINLNEDVSMMSMYLAHLYNNLSYSYKDQRQMIPANLLRFNMYIKIHDVRNMPFYMPDGTEEITSFDKSYQIYLLRDCTFIFKNSKNFDDTITVGGFDAGAPTKPSTISIEVVYKSIEIESEFPLIMDSLFDKKSSALKLNNKDKKIGTFLTDPTEFDMDIIYINHTKSPESLAEQIVLDSQLNNDPTLSGSTNGGDSAISNYKYDKVSSNTPNGTRSSSTKEIGKLPDDLSLTNKYIYVNWEQLQQFRETTLKTKSDPEAYNYKSSGPDRLDPNILQEQRENELYSGAYMVNDFDPADPNYVYRDSTLLDITRNSILNEINLSGFLMNLPYEIINLFFAGYHGMQPYYIPGSDSGPVYYGHRDRGGTSYSDNIIPVLDGEVIEGSIISNGGVAPNPDGLDGLDIVPEIENNQTLNGEVIDTDTNKPINLNGEVINIESNKTINLNGEVINIDINKPINLNGEFIPFALRPPQALDGEFIPFTLSPPQGLDGEFIPFALSPQIPLSGYIDTSFKILSPLSGYIDQKIKDRPDLEGFIDQTARQIGVISGTIDQTIKNRDVLSGSIDTSFNLKDFELGRLYTNDYSQRTINLGLLYVGTTKENILPLTYLYAKVDKFHNLANYYVYNTVITESKNLNNISIDQTTRDIYPFELVYRYDNDVEITKTLNNISVYNNIVNKINNINTLNIMGDIILRKKELEEVYKYDRYIKEKEMDIFYMYESTSNNNTLNNDRLYDNENIINKNLEDETIYQVVRESINVLNGENIFTDTIIEKVKVDLGVLYEPTKVKKLLVPNILIEPIIRGTVDLGKIYEIETKSKNIFKSIDKPQVELGVRYQNDRLDKIKIDQNIITKRPLDEQYIGAKEDKNKRELNKYDDSLDFNKYKIERIFENSLKNEKVSNDNVKEDNTLNNEHINMINENNRDKQELDGDTIFNQDMYKKNKEGLKDERLG